MTHDNIPQMDDLASQIILEEQITKALPGLRKDQRTAIFIDYNNIAYTLNDLRVQINMAELRKLFADRCCLIDSRLYYAFDYQNQYYVEQCEAFQKAGFTVTRKNVTTNHQGQRKGNMDTELAMDASSVPDTVEHVIIFSGDQDFIPLISKLRGRFKQVSVCSTRTLHPPVIRYEVIKEANNFYELTDLLPKIQINPPKRVSHHE